MKITLIVVRTLFGLLFLFASVTYFFDLVPQPEVNGKVKLFQEGIAATVYLLPLVKFVELICGIAFVTGFFVPLATVLIFPVTLNITLYSVFLAPEALGMGIIMLIVNLFLAYAHRENYQKLVALK